MTARRPRPAFAALVVVLLLAVAASAVRPDPADAGRRVTTPGFKGSTKRIAAKPTGAAAKPSPAIALATGARHPRAVVDAAGTAYVTWNVPTDGSEGPRREDAIGFCRLPRGATSCDNPPETRLLVPQKTYGPGDDPFLNQEASRGAAPVIVGDQLVILSTRYPTSYPLPDGDTTDRATIQFVSLDGGSSFSGGSPVTNGINVGDVPVAFGSDTSPRIGTLNPTDDGIVFKALSPGAFTGAGAMLEPGSLYGASTQLTRLPNGGIAALFADGPGSIGVRRFLGQGDPNDVANWTPKEHLQGYDPSIATGSGGRLLVARKEFFDHGVYTVQTLAGPGAATKPVPLYPVGLDAARIQGDGGPLTAAYVDEGGATDSVSSHTGLSIRRSPGGGSAFSAEQRITTTSHDTFEPSFDVAPDGGGFVAWAADDGAPAEIRGHFFGSLAKSSSPGLPTTTPGSATGDGNVTNADCQHRDFGKIRVRTENGCFLSGKRDGHAVAVSEGPIFVNGLKVTPIGKTQLVVDPKTRQLYTADGGQARVEIPSSETDAIVLWQGAIREKLEADAGGRIFHFDTKQFPVKVKGFPVSGALQAYVDGTGASIPLSLSLPTPFGDATADAVLKVTPNGLRLDSLKLAAPDFTVPPVQISDLRVSWQRDGDRWQGGAKITIPGGAALRVDVVIAGGKLVSVLAAYDLPFPGITLYPQVFLHQVSAGFGFSPLTLTGGAKVGAVAIAPGTANTPPIYVVDLDGKLTVVFGKPFVLRARGDASILSVVPVSDSTFEFSTAGYATFALNVGIGEDPWLYAGANFHVYVGDKGFQASAKGKVCALGACVGPQLYATQKGIGACAKVPLPTWDPPFFEIAEGSVQLEWGEDPSVDSGCDLSRIKIANTRAKGDGAPSSAPVPIVVPKGARSLSLNLRSAEGVPTVDLVTPSGTTIDPDAPGDRIGSKASDQVHHRAVIVDKPSSGTWKIVPRAGTPGLVRVGATVPGPAPKLRATLARKPTRAGKRAITYALTAVPDETVTFVERTSKGETPLPGGGRRGTVRFAPNALVPGRHTVLARILQDGIVKHERVVGRFTQPAFRLKAPARVTVRRAGRRLKVAFVPGRGTSARHLVEVRYGDGRRASAFLPAGRRSARFPAPRKGVVGAKRTTVSVRPVAPDGRPGRSRRATLR